MLVLSRRTNQKIAIGRDVVVTIVRVNGGTVRVGIDAPDQVEIRRVEVPPGDPREKTRTKRKSDDDASDAA